MATKTFLLVQTVAFLAAGPASSAKSLPTPEQVDAILRQTTVKTLYVVSSSHWDLGFADPTDVVQDRVKGHLDEVVANCLREPRLRWSVESVWQVLEWLKRTPDPGERGRFFELVREGRIGISATFGGMHTAHLSPEEVCRFLYPGQRIAKEHGVLIDTAMMNDVPGYSWSLPQAFYRAGVRYFITGVNTRFGGRLSTPLRDRPFWWVGRDGSRVLTWICHGYGEAARTYHLPPTAARFFADAFKKPWLKSIRDLDRIQELGMALALQRLRDAGYAREYLVTISSMDFISSDRAVQLHKWIDRWNAGHARPKIVQATPSQFFAAAVAQDGDDFPSYSGDFSGLWETGHATAPVFRSNVNALRELLGPLETTATLSSILSEESYPRLRLDESWSALLQCHEHGLGIGVGWPKLMTRAGVLHSNEFSFRLAERAAGQTKFLLRRHVRAIGERARAEAPTVLVYNPLPWVRSAPVHVRVNVDLLRQTFALIDEAADVEVPYDVLREDASIRFVARGLPSVGYKRFRIETGRETAKPSDGPLAQGGRLRNSFFEVQLDEATGYVTGVLDCRNGRELLERGECKFARLLRRGHRADFLGANAFRAADEGTAQVTYENGTTAASVIVHRTAAPLVRLKLTLFRDLDWLLIEMTLDRIRTRHVPRDEHSDHYYASFDFYLDPNSVQYRFDGPAGFLDAEKDFLPGAMRGRFVAHHVAEMIDSRGYKIALSPREASIGQVGPTMGRGPEFGPTGAHLLWKVLSDADEGMAKDLGLVRYPFIEPGSQQATCHFALRAVKEPPAGSTSYRFGVEQAVAPVACFLPPAVKPLFRSLPPRRPPAQSFLRVSPANVVLLTLKRPEDRGRREIILRFMELEGQVAEVTVEASVALESAVPCDTVERPVDGEPYPVSPLRFRIAPHQIVTIRARRRAPSLVGP